MKQPITQMVLARLAGPLHARIDRLRDGQLDEERFIRTIEKLLQRQHAWLCRRGVAEGRAAVAIHAAVLVLSRPGMRADAADSGVPMEVLEQRAIREAAADIAQAYGIPEFRAAEALARLVARHGGCDG